MDGNVDPLGLWMLLGGINPKVRGINWEKGGINLESSGKKQSLGGKKSNSVEITKANLPENEAF
ncbi:hypothetical protein M3226_04400 [Neobacillus cucumis]|uniref:hypothetical protein n=1 Tax=Neobacillus cucumis TaxID=1740721 RepID=UPI00203DD8BD|nr:hypothetical protein [Neobacillus cucumis]MCM3724939.1 hypothetical protein [Neobacillus cucumis]